MVRWYLISTPQNWYLCHAMLQVPSYAVWWLFAQARKNCDPNSQHRETTQNISDYAARRSLRGSALHRHIWPYASSTASMREKKNLSQFPWPILVGEKIPQHFPDFFRLPKYPNNPRYSQLVDTLDNTYKQNKTKHTLLATLAHYSSTLNWSGEYSRSGRTTSVQCRIFSFSDTLIFLKDGKYGREIWWGKLGCTLKWVPLEACATHIKN